MSNSYAHVINNPQESTNNLWVLISGALIFQMRSGFTLREAGIIRKRNTISILFTNTLETCVSVIAYWLIGYAIARGFPLNTDLMASSNFDPYKEDHYLSLFFSYSVAVTSSSIVTGSLAERAKLNIQLVYSLLMSTVICPVVMAWVWADGWLAQIGFLDFSGSGVIHFIGGFSGFLATHIIGPRINRFPQTKEKKKNNEQNEKKKNNEKQQPSQKENQKMFFSPISILNSPNQFPTQLLKNIEPEHHQAFTRFIYNRKDNFQPISQTNVVIGTFGLWVGFIFLIAGQTKSMFLTRKLSAPCLIVNLMLSGASGGLIAFVSKPYITKDFSITNKYDACVLCNGAISGLVAISGPCPYVNPGFAIIIGMISGLLYCYTSHWLVRHKIDDPVESSCVFGANGMWGLIATGIFHRNDGVIAGQGELLGIQVLGGLVMGLWCVVLSGGFWYGMKCLGQLRVGSDVEIVGLDFALMQGVDEIMFKKMTMKKDSNIEELYTQEMVSLDIPEEKSQQENKYK